MGAAKGARAKPRPQVPLRDRLGRFTRKKSFPIRDDMDDLLRRFEQEGILQVKFGELGVYTIENKKTHDDRGYLYTPITLWWKATDPAEWNSAIIRNSHQSYLLPRTTAKGQALQLNLGANFFGNYGKGATPTAAARTFLNAILSGVAIHRTGCGVLYSETAAGLNLRKRTLTKNIKIEVLPNPTGKEQHAAS